jgi:hypothetical protein
MNKVLKKVFVCALLSFAAAALLSGCSGKNGKLATDVTTIYIGTHAQSEDDPNWVNSVTGEPSMSPDRLRAATLALQTVKEELGVDIEWKPWPHKETQDILQTVLANDPYCHIAILSNGRQGTILGQNVLQPLDKYMDIFDSDPDAEWLKVGKTFGNYYLLNRDLLYITDWPMTFNINMIEAVPALRENGRTVYPSDLYEQGKWTWSTFEDYLSKIQAYYAGKKSASGNDIVPFNTSYSYTILQALHSNGAYFYDGNSMAFDTPEAIEAAEYLDSLMTKGLVSCSAASFGKSANNGYLTAVTAFMNGETVFTNCARWRMGAASTAMAERGESMGIIFFPRPDDIPFVEYTPETADSTKYEIAISCADSVGLLRGFSEEESRLALEAYKLYKIEFYKNLGRVNSIEEYKETMAPNEAIQFGIDIFHPEIGEENLKIFQLLGSLPENEYGESMDLLWSYTVNIFGESVYGIGGSPKYAIAVQSKKQSLLDKMTTIAEALKSDSATDAVAPSVSQVENVPVVFDVGTKPSKIDWTEIFQASDNVDGEYELKQEKGKILLKPENVSDGEEAEFVEGRVEIDYSAVDFDTVGKYEDALIMKVTDSSGNVGTKKVTVYIYNDKNTTPPTLVLKDEYDPLELDVDTSTVDWAGKFVEEASDVNGIDLSAYVSADVRELDVTKQGTYPVTIYVEDFAGNRTERSIKVKIEKK